MRYLADVLVPVDGAGSVHRPGVLDVHGPVVAYAGPPEGAPAPAGPVCHLGGLVMPGLVNTHAHSAMTLFRGVGQGLALDRWLKEEIWPREAHLQPDDVYWGTLFGCAELLGAGVTTTCEMYHHSRSVASAALDAGIRCVVTPGIFDLPGSGGPTWKQLLEDSAQLYADFHGRQGLLSIGLGPHSAYALPPEGLAATAALAGELGALVHTHLAETRQEGQMVLEAHGCSAPELLERVGLLDQMVLAAHSVWLNDEDLDRYRRHDVGVAHCPQSNGKLGSGVARLADLLDLGLRVGLGTDGPASNDNLDLWEELRLAPLLARLRAQDPTAIGVRRALHLATRGGADALHLATGTLEPGRVADFIRLDLAHPGFVPATDDDQLIGHLVWSAPSAAVTDVWVNGRQVVAARRCLSIDVELAAREVGQRARRLAGGVRA